MSDMNIAASNIPASKVRGTKVYNLQDEHLGEIDDIVLSKHSGEAQFAIMSFGGFLGIGEKRHPLPWQTLTYDEDKDGYVVNLSKEQLERAPTLDRGDHDRLKDRSFGASVYSHYGLAPYWAPPIA